MPANDESTDRSATAQDGGDAGAAASAHAPVTVQPDPIFIGHLPDGYEIPYGVTVHVLEQTEDGTLRDHQMSEDSIMRVDPATGETQQIYHGQVIDAQHPPQVHEGNPTPEPIFIGQLPDNYQMPYGQTVHVLTHDEDGALVDHAMSQEAYMHVNAATGEVQTIWNGQAIDPHHPPEPAAQTEPIFIGHVPEGYQMQPGVEIHVLEATPDGGFVDHRMAEEPIQRIDPATGDTLTIWHGAVLHDEPRAEAHADDAAPHTVADHSEHDHDVQQHTETVADGTSGHE